MTAPVLSIVIVNFETPEYTTQCLRSILEHRPSRPFETIVIDNDSQDGSLALIRERFPEAVCIETGANLGFARANNLGISNARGEYVLLLNSDTKIVDGSLDRMLEYLMEHPNVGAVGPKQFDKEGGCLQLSWGSFPTFFSEIFRKAAQFRLSINDVKVRDYLESKYSDRSDVDWISGSCLLARKDTLTDAGLLDGRFFMYFEDIDLCRRIKDLGFDIHYDPKSTVIHYGGISAKKNVLRVMVEYRRSQLYFTTKYYGWKGVLALKALLAVKHGVNFVRYGIAFAGDWALHRRADANFAKLLLSKKTIELVFSGKLPGSELGMN